MGLFYMKTPPGNFLKWLLTPVVNASCKQTSAILYFTVFVCRRIVCCLKSPCGFETKRTALLLSDCWRQFGVTNSCQVSQIKTPVSFLFLLLLLWIFFLFAVERKKLHLFFYLMLFLWRFSSSQISFVDVGFYKNISWSQFKAPCFGSFCFVRLVINNALMSRLDGYVFCFSV